MAATCAELAVRADGVTLVCGDVLDAAHRAHFPRADLIFYNNVDWRFDDCSSSGSLKARILGAILEHARVGARVVSLSHIAELRPLPGVARAFKALHERENVALDMAKGAHARPARTANGMVWVYKVVNAGRAGGGGGTGAAGKRGCLRQRGRK